MIHPSFSINSLLLFQLMLFLAWMFAIAVENGYNVIVVVVGIFAVLMAGVIRNSAANCSIMEFVCCQSNAIYDMHRHNTLFRCTNGGPSNGIGKDKERGARKRQEKERERNREGEGWERG